MSNCPFSTRTPEGEAIQSTLAELRKTPIDLYLGKGRFHIESTDYQPNPETTPSRFDRLCGHIRNAVMISYNWVFRPILAIGLTAFLVSAFVFWKRAIWNVCFVMALVCWGLAYERTTLLLLIDFDVVSGVVPQLSCASLFLADQRRRSFHRRLVSAIPIQSSRLGARGIRLAHTSGL